jgi:hypothetical protein
LVLLVRLAAPLLLALLFRERDAAVPLDAFFARDEVPLPLLEAFRVRADVPALALRVSPELCPPVSPSSWPISFFATPTAAGTATPSAAPATIVFFDTPPSSGASS